MIGATSGVRPRCVILDVGLQSCVGCLEQITWIGLCCALLMPCARLLAQGRSAHVDEATRRAMQLKKLNLESARAAETHDYAKALKLQEQGLNIAAAHTDRFWMGVFLTNSANVYELKGDYRTALDMQLKAVKVTEKIDTPKNHEDRLFNLGTIYCNLGQYDASLKSHRLAIELSRRIHDKQGEASALGNVGFVMNRMGHFEQALIPLRQALAIHETLVDPADKAIDLDMIAAAYDGLKKPVEASRYRSQAADLRRQADEHRRKVR